MNGSRFEARQVALGLCDDSLRKEKIWSRQSGILPLVLLEEVYLQSMSIISVWSLGRITGLQS